jgi:prepilin-type N-terminal cleavage/methylation domain-containing protein
MNFSFSAKNKSGFSLIEIALAMLVVAIGIPALLGLLGSGLNMNKSSQDDTVLGTFAQAYFSSVKSVASTNWIKIEDASTGTPAQAPGINSQSIDNPEDFKLSGGPYDYSITYGSSNFDTYQLRYSPDIDLVSTNLARVTLYVWPGEYGSTATSDATTFYTEIYRLN